MTSNPARVVWIDRPFPFERRDRGFTSIIEAVQLIYDIKIKYEWWLEYHKIILPPMSTTLAQAIAKTLLAIHIQHIREDVRNRWVGECRFDLTVDIEKPTWVQTYDQAREAKYRREHQ